MKKGLKFFSIFVLALLAFSFMSCDLMTNESKNKLSSGGEIDKVFPSITGINVISIPDGFVVGWSSELPQGKKALSSYGIHVKAMCQDEEQSEKRTYSEVLLDAKLDATTGAYYDDGMVILTNIKNNSAYSVSVAVYENIEEKNTDENGNEKKLIKQKEVSVKNYEKVVFGNQNVQLIDYSKLTDKYMLKVDPNAECVVLENVKSKNISILNYNGTKKFIDGYDSRFVIEDFHYNLKTEYNDYIQKYKAKNFYSELNSYLNLSSPKMTNFVEPDISAIVKIVHDEKSGRYALEGYKDNFDLNKLTTDGSTYRWLWLDNNKDLSEYKYKKVSLRAIGKQDDKLSCLVWVCDENYTSDNSSGKYVNSEVAQNIADTFVKYSNEERAVFGNELDYILKVEGNEVVYVPIENCSPTKNIVNIVLYDICQDYDENFTGGVGGYFTTKDYYAEEEKNFYWKNFDAHFCDLSNIGKYFYLDVGFCNQNVSENNFNGYEGGKKASPFILSALFHEFQHMIHFGIKEGKSNLWFNEMCSMLCEDIFQTKVGVPDASSPRGSRVSYYNLTYVDSAVNEHRYMQDEVLASYGANYTFGAWLSRNFGGIDFIHKLLDSQKVDMDAIIFAIKEVTGETYTQEELMELFMQAIALRTDFAVGKNIPTLFKEGQGKTFENGDALKLLPINIYSKEANMYAEFLNNNAQEAYINYGPLRFDLYSPMVIRPNNFILRDAGNTGNNSTALFVFNKNRCGDDVYIIIQDEFEKFEPSLLSY